MKDYYILYNGEPVPTDDMVEWVEWFGTSDRQVARTKIGECVVSTVFLGLDHSFGVTTGPILWETLVFGGDLDGEMQRYAARAEAQLGHERMVARVKENQKMKSPD